MNDRVLGKVVYLDGVTYQRNPDGSLVPIKSKSNWTKIEKLTEEDLVQAAMSDPDAQPFTDEELAEFKPAKEVKQSITLRVKPSVIRFFRESGKPYQTEINRVLEEFVEREGRVS